MKNIPQRVLQYNIGLIKYENPHGKNSFDLTTIHSLLIDQNPKFIQLKQLIANYNTKLSRNQVNRPHMENSFIQRLYKLLSQVTRIPNSQNQLKFLENIYAWAFQESNQNDNFNFNEGLDKIRPGTGSTKTRPYSSSFTRTRPDSAAVIPSKPSVQLRKTVHQEVISKKTMQKFPGVDFKQLKHGQRDFFLGHRTLHPEEERPKVRLRQYQRKVFYDEPDEQQNFKQFVQQKRQTFPKQKLVEIPLQEQINIQAQDNLIDQQQLQNNPDLIPGQQAGEAEDLGPDGEDVNIDDLGLDDDPGAQEEVQVVDKLRPRVKVYGNSLHGGTRQNKEDLQRGLDAQFKQRNKHAREVDENKVMGEMMQMWASNKNKIKIQQRRRAESARMMTLTKNNNLMAKQNTNEKLIQGNVIDLSVVPAVQTKTNVRPFTAFRAQSDRMYGENIHNAVLTGQLGRHVNLQGNNPVSGISSSNFGTDRISVVATKPKKKTFEQILRQAQEKVSMQTKQEIEQVKQKLIDNKIALGANRIYKSLSHHQPQLLDGEFVGQILGQGMIKNPFFKVAKKKKKKKKK